MTTDFADAAWRHWSDAELLREERRWPNADQLYGLAAECGLKAVMVALGMAVTGQGKPKSSGFQVHIDQLWDQFGAFATGVGAAQYASMLAPQNPYSSWRIDQRYWHTTATGETIVEQHRRGTQDAIKVLQQARQDGRIL